MPKIIPGSEQHLQQLVRQSSGELQLQSTDQGVKVELTGSGLGFLHSFVCAASIRRARQSNQLLLKACNNKQRSINRVLDLTAGWGMDSYILASHGQQVTSLEYNETIHAIVASSLQRLARCESLQDIAARMTLLREDASRYLQDLSSPDEYDCIYLDPMFAAHKSSAKAAKEMQILQALTDNSDIESCFEQARLKARKRVVIKRSAKAPLLGGVKPDLVHRAKTVRFDVYLAS